MAQLHHAIPVGVADPKKQKARERQQRYAALAAWLKDVNGTPPQSQAQMLTELVAAVKWLLQNQ